MFYKINPAKIFKLIGIPREIISYINKLDEISLKTLILIFSESKALKITEIAKNLNTSKLQIEKAIKFLASKKIIELEEQPKAIIEIQPISIFDITTTDLINEINKNPKLYIEAEKLLKKPLTSTERKTLCYISSVLNLKNEVILATVKYAIKTNKSIKQIEKICENWSDFSILNLEQIKEQIHIIEKIEKLFNRKLTIDEHKIILQIQQNLNLDIETILIAINYGSKNNIKSIKQIKKLCQNWANEGIVTSKQAEQQIKHLDKQKQIQNQIKNCLGIEGRKLSTNESNYIKIWCCDYNYQLDIISFAFNKCVDSIGKLSFPYMDKILQNWKNKGFKTKKDVQNENLQKQSSYNLQELIKLNEIEFLNDVKELEQQGKI